jgi:hypothetical protein
MGGESRSFKAEPTKFTSESQRLAADMWRFNAESQ